MLYEGPLCYYRDLIDPLVFGLKPKLYIHIQMGKYGLFNEIWSIGPFCHTTMMRYKVCIFFLRKMEVVEHLFGILNYKRIITPSKRERIFFYLSESNYVSILQFFDSMFFSNPVCFGRKMVLMGCNFKESREYLSIIIMYEAVKSSIEY